MLTTLNRLKARRNDEGFTLIELLIVIIILAILATIVIFAVGTTTRNAALAGCKSTVKTVQTALEAYKAQGVTTTVDGYPTAIATLTQVHLGKGPWLKQAPNTLTTATNLSKFGWAITTYAPASGTFMVKTKNTATGKATSSPTVCNGA